MKKKYFIIGVYSDLNLPSECFRPTQLSFESIQLCVEWIEVHKKFFAPSIHFGICSVDNTFAL